MKSFFSAMVQHTEYSSNYNQQSYICGIEDFNFDNNIADQVRSFFHQYHPDAGTISTVNVMALSPLELDSSNHTEKLIELWRIERTAGEYYGGKNTNDYINKELAKLGITL